MAERRSRPTENWPTVVVNIHRHRITVTARRRKWASLDFHLCLKIFLIAVFSLFAEFYNGSSTAEPPKGGASPPRQAAPGRWYVETHTGRPEIWPGHHLRG